MSCMYLNLVDHECLSHGRLNNTPIVLCLEYELTNLLPSVLSMATVLTNNINRSSVEISPMAEMIAPAHCVGPDYRPIAQKPTATVSTEISYDNVHILPQTPQLIALLTCVTCTPPALID